MDHQPRDTLDRARRDAGLSNGEMWLRYFALGGMVPTLELEAIVHGALTSTTHDRARIVDALNERFTELGRDHPVPHL